MVLPQLWPHRLTMDAWFHWKEKLRSPKFILAPMVDHSELPWRMLSKEYGCEAAYTPMFHALNFATQPKYRQKYFSTCPEDRPLFVQFCSNDPDALLTAARLVEDSCDGIDINLGCPQDIARRGHYGSFLQDDWNLISEMVARLRTNLDPKLTVSCKIRRFEQVERTVDYGRMLEKTGCTFIGLHGRTREQRGCKMGLADWDHIKAVKAETTIPLIANGNVQSLRDAEECLKYTGADAVMTAEGNLHNPCIFLNIHPPAWEVARRYLHYVDLYPVPASIAKSHLFKLFHRCVAVPENAELRDKLGRATTIEQLHEVVDGFESRYKSPDNSDQSMPITLQPVPVYLCQPRYRYGVGTNPAQPRAENPSSRKVVDSNSACEGLVSEKRIKLD